MMDFDVLVLDGANPTGVSMTRDIIDAARLLAQRTGGPVPTVAFHSPAGGLVRLQGGLSIATRAFPRMHERAPVLLVPGLWIEHPRELRTRLARADARAAIRYIARRSAAGATVAASCSAVFLLQAAGVLRGRRATTTWWLAPELARLEPAAHVEGNRILCVDGPVVTAGAAFAQADILLHLLRQRFGGAVADGVGRVLLLHERSESAQYGLPSMLASSDPLVTRLTERVERALPDVPSVASLAREFCVSERTLGRHVRRATGMATRMMIQSIRLHRARALLQGSRLSVDEVASAVGYGDTTALRRLMRKLVGTTPGRVRAARAIASSPHRSMRRREALR
ncbi:MAG TPA: helix-turn-helix domain-containing protein [Dokdonella sp.]